MDKIKINQLWFDVYFNISPLVFEIKKEKNEYFLIYKPTNEKVNSLDEAKSIVEKYKIQKELKK